MLPSDLWRPSRSALARLGDSRVAQFWDPGHVIAARLSRDSQNDAPECCSRKGVLWDLAVVIPAGGKWEEKLPKAVLFDGTMVRVKPQIESAVASGVASAP
jgi:hypothetical protein